MDSSRLRVPEAASRVLSDKRPERAYARILRDYADAEIPKKADLPIDELATVIALGLMDIRVDLP